MSASGSNSSKMESDRQRDDRAVDASSSEPPKLIPFESHPVYPCGDLSRQEIAIDSLSIATFNTLCDWHASDRIQTEKRLPEIARHLHIGHADIIAIQEATPILLEHLLAQDWMTTYSISEWLPGETLQPYGVLLLSRFPFTLVEHSFSTHKRVLVGTWQWGDRDLHVATLHLPSDFADYAREQRHSQLKKVLTYLNTLPGDSILAGDFNTRGDDLDELVARSGWGDVWQQLHPNEPGYTFDPPSNPLAASNSQSGRGARFDRILLRNPDSTWKPRSIELFACEPVPGTGGQLYPSDHFGVRAIFKKTNINPA
jgi:poly(A) polymerase